MNILLLGGTGAIGNHVATLLSKRHEISVTSRQTLESKNNIRYIQGNAKDDSFLEHILTTKWDAIIDFMVYKTEEFKIRINTLLASTPHYIFLSSSRVYANSSNPITEESPRLLDVCNDREYLKTDEYGLTKARQEDVLFNSHQTNFTVIRPYITFGHARFQLGIFEKEGWLHRALCGRDIIFSESLKNKLTTITSGNHVAKSIAAIAENQNPQSDVFHITSSKCLTWKDVISSYSKIIQRTCDIDVSVKYVDTKTFNTLHNSYYQLKYDREFNRAFCNDKIHAKFSIPEIIDPMAELEKAFESFLLSPVFNYIDWNLEMRKDKISDQIAAYSDFKSVKTYLKYHYIRLLN